MRAGLYLIIPTALASACGGGTVSEKRNALDAVSFTSALALPGGAKALIEKAYTGGATGDTLHKAWICQANLSDCEVVGIVDTHEGPPPIWKISTSGLELVIGPEDTVWGFSNFSWLPGPGDRSIRIRVTERRA